MRSAAKVCKVTVLVECNLSVFEFVDKFLGKLEKPLRELKAYGKTPLIAPGESAVVEMDFPLSDLASFDEDRMAWVTDAGTYTLSVGASVEDIRATMQLAVKRETVKPVKTRI